jgi:hypothetical protein
LAKINHKSGIAVAIPLNNENQFVKVRRKVFFESLKRCTFAKIAREHFPKLA